jgi:hypothetical protein
LLAPGYVIIPKERCQGLPVKQCKLWYRDEERGEA